MSSYKTTVLLKIWFGCLCKFSPLNYGAVTRLRKTFPFPQKICPCILKLNFKRQLTLHWIMRKVTRSTCFFPLSVLYSYYLSWRSVWENLDQGRANGDLIMAKFAGSLTFFFSSGFFAPRWINSVFDKPIFLIAETFFSLKSLNPCKIG